MAIDYRKFAKEFLNVMKEEAESKNNNRNDSYDDEDEEEEYEVEFTSVSTNRLPDGKKGSGK